MRFFLLIFIFLTSLLGYSQQKKPFVNVTDLIEKYSSYADKEEYLKAINVLDSIPRNDTIYCAMLVDKSYMALRGKMYDKIDEILEDSKTKGCDATNFKVQMNKVAALLNQKEYQKGIELSEELLKTYPYNHSLLFNRALAYSYLGDYEKATQGFIKALQSRPLDDSTHLQLGLIAYKSGLTAQAMMCFNMWLLLQDNISAQLNFLQQLNNTSTSPYDGDVYEGKISLDDQYFSELNLFLDQKIALDDSYDTGMVTSIPLVKQNHLLFTYISTNQFEEKDIWTKAYVPAFKLIMNDKNGFRDFTSYLVQSADNEVVQKETKRYVDDGLKIGRAMVSTFISQMVNLEKGTNYGYDGQILNSVGLFENETPKGPYKFYNSNGRLSAEGEFNMNGEKTGEWKYYYDDGGLKEISFFKKDQLNGITTIYDENGRKDYSLTYKNDEYSGPYVNYSPSGAIEIEKNLNKEGNDGEYLGFFKVGKPLVEYKARYVDNVLQDTLYEYYANGNLYETSPYKGDQIDGLVQTYYSTGELYAETNLVEGKLNGPKTIYYKDGKIKSRAIYEKGKLEGPFVANFSNNKPYEKYTFKNDELHGSYQEFTRDGVLWYEYEYRRGELRDYKFYDKQGKVIASGTKEDGKFDYKGYTPSGILFVEGLYDVDGGKIGPWKYYYKSTGELESTGNYDDGKSTGEFVTYYGNGIVKSRNNYESDKLEGYSVEYYQNGKMKNQGYYKDGEPEGEWNYYFIDGSLSGTYYFNAGKVNGEAMLYSISGELQKIETFEKGTLISEQFYYPDGTKAEYFTYPFESGTIVHKLKRKDGSVARSFTYVNGILHGPTKHFGPDNTLMYKSEYVNGDIDGVSYSYDAQGNLESEYPFDLGTGSGTRKIYFSNGKVSYEYELVDNLLEGEYKSYYDNGNIELKAQYINDMLHGARYQYDREGALQIVRFYDMGVFTGYSYENEDGTLVDTIPVIAETADVKAYYANGQKSREYRIEKGDLMNTYLIYHPNGKLKSKTPYKNGSPNGECIVYYDNGQIKQQYVSFTGQQNGKETNYYTNGTIKSEIEFLLGKRHGTSIYYNEDGQITRKEIYYNDEIQSID